MSLKYNKDFRSGLSRTTQFFSNLGDSFMSVLYMTVLSSRKVVRQNRQKQCGKKSHALCVLGNGPSLKAAMEQGEVMYEGNDIACVNLFCVSEYFEVIKPQYYFITDLAYFEPKNERHEKLVDKLVNGLGKVNWDMTLVVPNVVPKGSRFIFEVGKIEKIKIQRINTTRIEGFQSFCHHYYSRQMAVPRCENIVGIVLTKAVSWDYKTVYLYGADHSWTRDLFVDDNNVVCYGDRHVYDTNLSIVKMPHPLWMELRSFTRVFKAYMTIQEYAKSKGCVIYNCTKESFIDAYPRYNQINNNK